MAEKKFSLKDQLFNAESLGALSVEYAAGLPGFDAEAYTKAALSGIADRSLVACLDWFADCLEPYLSTDFNEMADQLEATLPPPLDPTRKDDDFGKFVHSVPGVLAVRHGLEHHRDRALDLLYAATQRFSMELYIRDFLNRWPNETLERMMAWAQDDNYHVRRLVSEGTRPKLPWARAISLAPEDALPFLDTLHADGTRFVTRSVANHLNDIAKIDPALVVATLRRWREAQKQNAKELDWMTRHALRTLIKQGDPGAMDLLGYRQDADVKADVRFAAQVVEIDGFLEFEVDLLADVDLPVVIDYRLTFARPSGKTGQKVFKLKTTKLKAGVPMTMSKRHRLIGDATTFTLHPGPHDVAVQINGRICAEARFELVAP